MTTIGSNALPARYIKHEITFLRENTPEELAAAEKMFKGGPTQEDMEKANSVKAVAIFREKSTGKVLGIQWADGGTTLSSAAAADAKGKAVNNLGTGLTSLDRQNDYFIRELSKFFGSGAVVERYAGASAPKRGDSLTDPRLLDKSAKRSSYGVPPFA